MGFPVTENKNAVILSSAISRQMQQSSKVALNQQKLQQVAATEMVLTDPDDLFLASNPSVVVAVTTGTFAHREISLVTNPGAGLTKERLNHEEVLAAGLASATKMGNLLKKVIENI